MQLQIIAIFLLEPLYWGSFSAKFTIIPGVKPNSLRAVLGVIILITELLVHHINNY